MSPPTELRNGKVLHKEDEIPLSDEEDRLLAENSQEGENNSNVVTDNVVNNDVATNNVVTDNPVNNNVENDNAVTDNMVMKVLSSLFRTSDAERAKMVAKLFGASLSGESGSSAGSETSKSSVASTSAESTSVVLSPQITSVQKKWAIWDAAYVTPTFQIQKFREEERLVGHKNFKSWIKMVNLDLAALNLVAFIREESASSIPLSPAKRTMLDAQTLQYIKASVSRNIASHLTNVYSAYSAMEMLKTMFENNRAVDLVDLHKRFSQLRFKKGFDAVRYCADFDALLEEFKAMETKFSDRYIATIFLEKIDGTKEHISPFFSFVTTLATLLEENQTYSYVKAKFLEIASSQRGEKRTRVFNEKENKEPAVKRAKLSSEQLEKLKSMSKEERRRIQCYKCGAYFHKAEKCPNKGRVCFICHMDGHEAKDCTKKGVSNSKTSK